jgi:hypothetical protein
MAEIWTRREVGNARSNHKRILYLFQERAEPFKLVLVGNDRGRSVWMPKPPAQQFD